MLSIDYFGCARILFWCAGIVVSGGWGVGRKSGLCPQISEGMEINYVVQW